MYIPKSFEVSDPDQLKRFISNNGFATLISAVEESQVATHLPLILEEGRHPIGKLVGHVARANTHWEAFNEHSEALAISQGPPRVCVTDLVCDFTCRTYVDLHSRPRIRHSQSNR